MRLTVKKVKGDIGSSVRSLLGSLDYNPVGHDVFIKPNIVDAFKPDSPYITNPRIVDALIDYLREKGAKNIVVGEGPVGRDVEKIFRVSGYERMCKSKNVELLNLDDAKRVKHNGIMLPKVAIYSEYINVAKLKSHIQTTVTLGLKNQKGLLRLEDKRAYHRDWGKVGHRSLHENIASLASVIKPALTIVDALNGVEGNGPGPTGAKVDGINLLVASYDIVAVDTVCTKIMGIDANSVKHIRLADKAGVGSIKDGLDYEIDAFKKFELPTRFHRTFNAYYWWDDTTCSGCSQLMGDLKSKAMSSPGPLYKLFNYGVLRRVDFVTANLDKPPVGHGRIICIGACSKKFADKYGFEWIPGCPPKVEEIFDKL